MMRMITPAATMLLVFMAGGVSASCMDIEDPAKRMECYHTEIEAMKSAPASPNKAGSWIVSSMKSKLDDSTTVAMMLAADTMLHPKYIEPIAPILSLRCDENTTSATIWFSGFFMGDFANMGRVDYRVDDRPAKHRNFDVSTANEHLGLWTGARSIGFIQELLDGKTLYIEATPVNENTVNATFNIAGLSEAIKPLRDSCGW